MGTNLPQSKNSIDPRLTLKSDLFDCYCRNKMIAYNPMVVNSDQVRVLDDREILAVNGGNPAFLAGAAVAAAGLGLFSASYAAGEKFGQFFYQVMH